MFLHQLARLGAVGRDIGAIARQGHENFGRQPPQAGGRRLHRPVYVALALGNDVEKALAVDRQLHRPADVRIVEGRSVAVDQQIECHRCRRHLADRIRRLALDVARRLQGDLIGEAHVELAGDKRECLGRPVRDDRPLDAIEVGPAGLPVVRVLDHPDVFVWLEFGEFEGPGTDRVGAHVARIDMARIDRRHTARQQHQKRRLRALQHKRHRVIAFRHDVFEVAVPGLARVEPQLLLRFAGQHVPGAFDVGRRKRLAVMPFDALPQLEGEPGVALVPRPAFGQFRLDEFRPVLLFVLLEQHEVVEHPHEGRDGRNRRFLMDRCACRAIAVKEFEDPAALLGVRGARVQPKNGANR